MAHQVLVVPILIEDHPNGQEIGIVRIGGYTVVVNKEQWKDKKTGAFCPPESILPNKPEYSWLGDTERKRTVKAKKIRGVVSYGLLVEAPINSNIGDDVTKTLEIKHYNPINDDTVSTKADSSHSPKDIIVPKYDVEALRKATEVFSGVHIVATEKVHGCVHADTKVMMVNGEEKTIKELQIGDKVLTYNTTTNEFEEDRVLHHQVKQNNLNWVELEFDNGRTIKCTEDHKILTKNRGYVEAINLTDHDDIVSF